MCFSVVGISTSLLSRSVLLAKLKACYELKPAKMSARRDSIGFRFFRLRFVDSEGNYNAYRKGVRIVYRAERINVLKSGNMWMELVAGSGLSREDGSKEEDEGYMPGIYAG